MNNYFENCETAEQLKARYRELCKKMHPDTGGNEKLFVDMKAQYEQRLETLLNNTKNKSKIEYRKLLKLLVDFISESNPEFMKDLREKSEFLKSVFVATKQFAPFIGIYSMPENNPKWLSFAEDIYEIINQK